MRERRIFWKHFNRCTCVANVIKNINLHWWLFLKGKILRAGWGGRGGGDSFVIGGSYGATCWQNGIALLFVLVSHITASMGTPLNVCTIIWSINKTCSPATALGSFLKPFFCFFPFQVAPFSFSRSHFQPDTIKSLDPNKRLMNTTRNVLPLTFSSKKQSIWGRQARGDKMDWWILNLCTLAMTGPAGIGTRSWEKLLCKLRKPFILCSISLSAI